MATLVTMNLDAPLAQEVYDAIENIRAGLGTLKKLDGVRAELIAVSPAKLGEQIGVVNTGQAQAFNDRWNAVAAGTYTGLGDLINALVEEVPAV
jgi:hypothetical protein